MESKIVLPESVCHDDVVGYIASRYSMTPSQVISHYMRQEGIMGDSESDSARLVMLEENEMAIFRDMGLRPSCVEFVDISNSQK